MRVAKFRGKSLNSGEWLYGELVMDAAGKPRITNKDRSGQGLEFHRVEPETVGMGLGFKDCGNEWEIFEGDIVVATLDDMTKTPCEVRIGQNYESAYCAYLYNPKLDCTYYFRNPGFFKIIGNIHEK